MHTGTMSTPLMWFKSKLMKLVTYGKWELYRRIASAYYNHCTVIDEAMGLWILHHHDIDTIIKKEDDDIKKEDDGDGIEEESTSKQKDDNLNKCSRETVDDSNDNTDNKDGKNQNRKKAKESQSFARKWQKFNQYFLCLQNLSSRDEIAEREFTIEPAVRDDTKTDSGIS